MRKVYRVQYKKNIAEHEDLKTALGLANAPINTSETNPHLLRRIEREFDLGQPRQSLSINNWDAHIIQVFYEDNEATLPEAEVVVEKPFPILFEGVGGRIED